MASSRTVSDDPERRRWRRSLAGAVLVAALAASGCQDAGGAGSQGESAVQAPAVQRVTAPVPLRVTVTPGDDATGVGPRDPVTVKATGGRLTSVEVVAGTRRVRGRLSADGAAWTATGRLRFATPYTVRARAVSDTGRKLRRTTHFRTAATPRARMTASVLPRDGKTVGVGMPIVVRFSRPVTDRARVERALHVASTPAVDGAWHWLNASEVHFRPKAYWPHDSAVTVRAELDDVGAGRGIWGSQDRTVRFRTGASMVSVVDVDAHTMTVRRNGLVVRTIPVTTGKAGFRTRGGVKVISEKYRVKVMDASTVAIAKDSAEYYRLTVPYAMRVTTSGEFVHAAPWSVGSQGRANVSHGCIGMSVANAAWLYRLSRVGDIVEVVGTDRPLEPGNGWTDWNVPWKRWKAGSALA